MLLFCSSTTALGNVLLGDLLPKFFAPMVLRLLDFLPHSGAHGGAELVGAQGVMDGDAGDEVGGQGDEPAATGDGVHKPGDAHQGTDD